MKNKMLKVTVFGLSALVLAGCSGKDVEITADKAKDNEIIVTQKDKIQGVIKEKFDKKYYEEKGLKTFIEDDLKEFNSDNGTSIKLNSIKVKDKNVYAVLDYKTAEEYNEYNDYQVTIMKASVAKEANAVPDKLTTYGKKKKQEKGDVLSNDMKVVVIQEKPSTTDDENIPSESKVDLKLTVAGKIKYVAGASKDDGNTAKISTLKKPVVVVYK